LGFTAVILLLQILLLLNAELLIDLSLEIVFFLPELVVADLVVI